VLYIPYLDVLLCLQNALPLPMQGDAVVSWHAPEWMLDRNQISLNQSGIGISDWLCTLTLHQPLATSFFFHARALRVLYTQPLNYHFLGKTLKMPAAWA
jgi:hypothetical protein